MSPIWFLTFGLIIGAILLFCAIPSQCQVLTYSEFLRTY